MLREFAVPLPCGEMVTAIRQMLAAAGLRVEQSFDLRVALALVPNCTCPHHGTALCDCQYNVLLVYKEAMSAPVTLVAHGHDKHSWIIVSDPPDGRAPSGLSFEIVQTLAVAHLIALNEDRPATPSASAAH